LGENELGNLRIAVDVPGEKPNYRKLHLPSLTYPGVVTITPEEPFEERINLRELEPSSVPDELQIAIEIMGGPPGEEPIKTDILQINMVQLDSAQLAKACEDIANSIRRTYAFEQRSELASELASVRDPVAVTTITSLLGKKMGIDNQLIDGLEAIGTQQAKDVLLSYISHSINDEDTQYAKSAINRMDHAGQR
jgi:hypothetical protein